MTQNTDKATDIFYKILSEHKELSALPQILAEVLKVAADNDSSASDLARVIMKDPSLTSKILRVVNAPFWGQSREITTVNQAVVTLGTRSVTAITLSASLYDFISKVKSAVNRRRFWRHSLEVAIASRLIAEECGYNPSEEAFVSGLLHDIGILILESSFPDEFRRIWKLVEAGESQVELEQRTWGTDHARVGQFLLDQWRLPRLIGAAIVRHHEIFPIGENSPESKLAQIVNLANHISRFRTHMMPPPEAATLENKDIIASNLGISQTALAGIGEKLVSEVVKESSFLEIEIGNTEELLQDANRQLFRQLMTVENLLRENRTMKQQIGRDQVKKAALESLKTVVATFAHYLESVVRAITGRAESLEQAITEGEIDDRNDLGILSIQVILNGVETSMMILEELRQASTQDNIAYQDESYFENVKGKIEAQLSSLEKIKISSGV